MQLGAETGPQVCGPVELPGAAPWSSTEPFGGGAIGAGIGRAGIPAPNQFRRVRVHGEKRATCCALRSDDTEVD
jgi:hypothetical protein